MKELFANYAISLAIKEKGFNEPCFAKFNRGEFQMNSLGGGNNYNNGSFGKSLISAPLYQQIVDFFINKHGIEPSANCNSENKWCYSITDVPYIKGEIEYSDHIYSTRYEALDAGILEALKLI